MIDKNLILNDFDNSAKKLSRKGFSTELLEEAKNILVELKKNQTELDNNLHTVNKLSKEIGSLTRSEGNSDAVSSLKEQVSIANTQIEVAKKLRSELENKFNSIYFRIPNFPADDCPEGKDENDNVYLRYEGYDEEKYRSKLYKPHWEIASNLGIMDLERASKVSGSMFSILRGKGARLLRALVELAFDLHRDKYEEFIVPHLISTETFTSTGHLPKFADDAFKIENDNLWLIPTGEVPLMGLHRDEILSISDLPKRYFTYTSCFRRESGAYGKDTRGMQRLHEFHKVELVKLCTQEQVSQEFDDMLKDAEKILNLLKLPYRVVDLCAGDLTFSSARVFDLEVYSPGVDKWLEVSSVGIFTDFQARRGNIRYRSNDGSLKHPFALNGSAMATPRVWAAILEHYQNEDGSITVPDVLRNYMKTDIIQ